MQQDADNPFNDAAVSKAGAQTPAWATVDVNSTFAAPVSAAEQEAAAGGGGGGGGGSSGAPPLPSFSNPPPAPPPGPAAPPPPPATAASGGGDQMPSWALPTANQIAGQAASQAASNIIAEQKDQLNKLPPEWKKFRVWNAVNVILTIVVSLMQVISTSNSISVAILSIYAMIFSCILCCYEMHTKLVAMVIVDYLGFMYNYKLRSVFMTLIGLLVLSYDSVLGYLVGCSILASVPYHIYGIIKYPGREKEVMMADLGISAEQQAQSAHV